MRRILSRRTMPDTQPIKDYLCVELPSGGNVRLIGNKPTTMDYVKMSLDGRNWQDITNINLGAGDKVYIKGSGSAFGKDNGNYSWQFQIQGTAFLSGNIMSLLYDDDFEDKTIVGKNAFAYLFAADSVSKGIANISNLKLPATEVGDYAYTNMFAGTSTGSYFHPFTKTPKLPATTLGIACYKSMFAYSKVDEMPDLPATTLAEECYSNMFQGCNIKEAKMLPATVLAPYCYTLMFAAQKSAIHIPHNMLPATTLATSCYNGMFYHCPIEAIPSDLLPASTHIDETTGQEVTDLAEDCYVSMFDGCTALTYIPDRLLPATILAKSCYRQMFRGCTGVTRIPRNLLPATTLADSCYESMFGGSLNYNTQKYSGGTSITSIPQELLHASTLASNCYKAMFAGCASLIHVVYPIISENTQLYNSCFDSMFRDCTALVSTDKHLIPTSILASGCCSKMFMGCTHLTNTITFGSTVYSSCYESMYEGCTALTDFEDLPATTLADSCYKAMFKGTGIVDLTGKYLPANIGTTGQYVYQSMFEGCESLTDVPADFIRATTFRSVGCCQAMFKGCKKLSVAPYLNPTDLIAAGAAFQEMFMACYEEKTIEGETVYTGLTRMAYLPGESHSRIPFTSAQSSAFEQMFNGCMALEEVPVMDITVALDTALKAMFMSCKSITELPILYIQTPGTSACESMFQGCSSLTEIPNGFLHSVIVGGAYTANGWAASMFKNCTALEDIPSDLFDGQNLNSNCFAHMFENCISLETAPNLPIVSSNIGGAYQCMFSGCTALKYIPTLSSTNPGNNYVGMYSGCTSLRSENVPALPTPIGTNTASYQEMFKGCTSLTRCPQCTINGYTWAHNMFEGCTGITTFEDVTFDGDGWYAKEMFKGCTSLRGGSKVKGKEVTTNGMFQNCTALESIEIDLEYTGSSGIFKGQSMFNGCTSLVTATGSIKGVYEENACTSMFQGCISLTTAPTITLSGITKTSVCASMFQGCASLTKVEGTFSISDFSSGSMHFGYMFKDCTLLTEIPTFVITTQEAGYECYCGMFQNCKALTSIPSELTSNLTSLKLVDNYRDMFNGCTNLTGKLPAGLLPAETATSYCYERMFKDTGITGMEDGAMALNTFAGSSCCSEMFAGCKNLASVYCVATNPSASYTGNWLNGAGTDVQGEKTFTQKTGVTWPSGVSGIPEGWTAEYVNN